MEFGLDKCAVIHIVKGEIINSLIVEGIPLLSSEDNYKYLGLIQCDEIIHDKVKESTKKEYFSRVRNIVKSGISSKNVTQATTTTGDPQAVLPLFGLGVQFQSNVRRQAFD